MATFTDAKEVYDTIAAFLAEITAGPLREKFLAADTSFHVVYDDPASDMVVDCTQDPPVVTCDVGDADTEIELRMSADDGHQFWLGKLNMTIALAKGKVKVKGPISKIMRLLPAMRPAFPMYKDFLEANGFAEKVA